MSTNGKEFDSTGVPNEEYLARIYGDAWKDDSEPEFKIRDWGMSRYEGEAKPIDWLIEDILGRGVPGLISSMGGLGKSYLLLDVCICVASGSGEFGQFALGGAVQSSGKAVMVTAEESFSALHRRVDQILNPASKKKLEDRLFLVPLPDTGGTTTFMRTVRGECVMTGAWTRFCEQILELGDVDLVVLDPLQTLISAELNDPSAAQTFWAAVSALCAKSGASVLVAHHMRKQGEIIGTFQAREAIRGSSALVDGARWVYALWPASDDERTTSSEAMGYTIGPMELVHGAVVKSNDIGVSEMRTYLRDVETGLLVDRTDTVRNDIAEAQHISDDQKKKILDEVSRRWQLGRPYSSHPNSKERWLGRFMCNEFGVTRACSREFIRTWMDEGFLVKEWHATARKNGLRVG
tara:strand:- start:264 stop:1484 length:1221 start_codon:yes stop_codon:yes gene_type:complete